MQAVLVEAGVGDHLLGRLVGPDRGNPGPHFGDAGVRGLAHHLVELPHARRRGAQAHLAAHGDAIALVGRAVLDVHEIALTDAALAGHGVGVAGALAGGEVHRARRGVAALGHQRTVHLGRHLELGHALGDALDAALHGLVRDRRRAPDIGDLGRRLDQLEVLDEQGGLSDQGLAEERLVAQVIVRAEVVVGHLEPDAAREEALLVQDALDHVHGVLGLAAAPAAHLIGEAQVGELGNVGEAREHRQGPRLEGEEQHLRLLIALGPAADKVVDVDRREHQEKVDAFALHGGAHPGLPGLELLEREVVLGHVVPPSVVWAPYGCLAALFSATGTSPAGANAASRSVSAPAARPASSARSLRPMAARTTRAPR